MKKFKDFRISAKPFVTDVITGALWQLPINGISEYESYIDVYAEEESEITRSDVEKILTDLKNENLIESFKVETFSLEDKNWNAEWEKNIGVIEVSEKIVIKPSFKDYIPKEGQVVIEIDPKMSFGTGEHETTRLALRLIEKYVSSGDKVLDVGSGTAVLSICTVKLGASYAVAVDNNEWCYENGLENVERNGVAEKVEIKLGEVYDVEKNNFDLVIANINKNVLLEIKESLASKVKHGGHLILSGVLLQDEKDIKKAYSDLGLQLIETQAENEWTALLLMKNLPDGRQVKNKE